MPNDDSSLGIEARGLTKAFDRVVAVRDLNLQVAPGTLFGFLGPNGSGKSTTVKLLTGLLAPTAGEVRVAGQTVSLENLELRRVIGILPEDAALFHSLTIWEHLELSGPLYGSFIPLITLLAISAPVYYLLFWSFRRSLFSQTPNRAEGRAIGSGLWFPGRFGGLVRKEQYYFRKLLDVWPGLLLVLAISVASLFGPLPPIVHQSIMLIVFVLNVNVIMNCFGMDTPAELNRYSILPLRGRDVLLVKNLGLTVIVAAPLALLILTAAWRSGLMEAGAEIIEAAVLLLSHLAWGNMVSVSAPFKMPFYRFASNGAPLTAMAGTTIGSAPGVMVLFVLYSGSPLSALAMTVILLLVMAVYLISLRYAGRSFEHRRHIIGERLA